MRGLAWMWTAARAAVVLAALGGAALRPTLASAERAFDGERAYSDLAHQTKFGPRVPGRLGHAQCALWLVDTLYESADAVTIQPFSTQVNERTVKLTNIIATINPRGEGHVLLCAHWDTRPTADSDPDPRQRQKPVPGANDGASGVAVLLEIARALKAAPPRQRVTIALFDGEDYGKTHDTMLLGSRFFADSFTGPPVSWAVLLDMVGDKDLRLPVEQASQQAAPAVVERVWEAARRVGASAFVRESGPGVMDDHVPLLAKGIPCIDVIDFDYPYWHTTADTADKCSAESLGQVGRTILAALDEAR